MFPRCAAGFSSSVVILVYLHVLLLFLCVLDSFSIPCIGYKNLQYILSYIFHCSTMVVVYFLLFDSMDVEFVVHVVSGVTTLGKILVSFSYLLYFLSGDLLVWNLDV